MQAKFVEFNGRVSIHVCTEHGDEGEMLLMKMFLDQLNKPGMRPLMVVGSGSAHGNEGQLVCRHAQFGQYSSAELGQSIEPEQP